MLIRGRRCSLDPDFVFQSKQTGLALSTLVIQVMGVLWVLSTSPKDDAILWWTSLVVLILSLSSIVLPVVVSLICMPVICIVAPLFR